MKKIKSYIKLMRPKHYIKNFLILLPLIFSKSFFYTDKLIIAIWGMGIFCLISSIVYIINDIKDVEKDRNHPIKKNRPIANGDIKIKEAVGCACTIFIITIFITIACYIKYSIPIVSVTLYLMLYIILNIAYSFGLKNKPIVDIVILVSGFLIRILFGGTIIQVEISNWLYLTIISGAFYMSFGKRRNELLKHDKSNTRNVLKFYTKEFLDKNMNMFLGLTICFYALWAMNNDNVFMIWTVPLVMITILKYSYHIEKNESEGDPVNIILNEKWLILMSLIYMIMVLSILCF